MEIRSRAEGKVGRIADMKLCLAFGVLFGHLSLIYVT